MAEGTLTLELVAPERRLLEAEAEMVVLPGVEGEFGAMERHAPVISALRPGLISVHAGGSVTEYVVTGGFAEVTGSKVLVLAEEAAPREQFDSRRLNALADAAQETMPDRADALRGLAERLG